MTPEHMRHLNGRSAHLRTTRRAEALALRAGDPAEAVRAVAKPSPELASYRIGALLAPADTRRRGIIPFFSGHKLDRLLRRLQTRGQDWAHRDKRLRDLTAAQRRMLAAELARSLPRSAEQWKRTRRR